MNLLDAARFCSDEAGITQAAAKQVIEAFLGLVVEEVATHGMSKLYGLGTFKVYNTAPKKVPEVFNGPRVKEMPSRRVVKFAASPTFNKEIGS